MFAQAGGSSDQLKSNPHQTRNTLRMNAFPFEMESNRGVGIVNSIGWPTTTIWFSVVFFSIRLLSCISLIARKRSTDTWELEFLQWPSDVTQVRERAQKSKHISEFGFRSQENFIYGQNKLITSNEFVVGGECFSVNGHETIMFQCENGGLSVYGNLTCGATNFGRYKTARTRWNVVVRPALRQIDCGWMGALQRQDVSWTLKTIIIYSKGRRFYSAAPTKIYISYENRSRNFPFPWLELWDRHRVPHSGRLTVASSCLFVPFVCIFRVFGKRPTKWPLSYACIQRILIKLMFEFSVMLCYSVWRFRWTCRLQESIHPKHMNKTSCIRKKKNKRRFHFLSWRLSEVTEDSPSGCSKW